MKPSNGGFSLIEIMIAMLIMLISTLGVYGAIATTMQSNARNAVRDEGVRTGEQVVNEIRSLPYDDIGPETGKFPGSTGWTALEIENALDHAGGVITRTIRKNTTDYTVGVNVVYHFTNPADPEPELKDVQVRTSWMWGDQQFTHTVGTVVRNPE